jgi:hypothetical protein
MLGVGASGVLIFLLLYFSEFDPWLYRGGFLLLAGTTAAVVTGVVHPRAKVLPRLFGSQPLRWIGLRSYGIYLWHWPVLTLTRPQLDVPLSGVPLLVIQMIAIGILAELSYRYVETPIRAGVLERIWKAATHAWLAWRAARGRRRWWLGLQWTTASVTVAACAAALAASIVFAPAPTRPAYLAVDAVHRITTPPARPTTGTTRRPAPAASTSSRQLVNESASTSTPFVGGKAERVTLIGDSVMVGAANAVEQSIGRVEAVEIDARIGRQASDTLNILRARRAAGELGDVVVIQTGTNGTVTTQQMDEMLGMLTSIRRVIFVNVKVPRVWEDANNRAISDRVKRYPNAALVDWYSASEHRPDLFWDDGIHLRPKGATFYADLIAASIGAA